MSTDILLSGRAFRHFAWNQTAGRKQQMLNWANQFNICCFMDNHGYKSNYHSFECLLAAGAYHSIQLPAGNALSALREFQLQHADWLIGHLGFGMKAETMGSKTELPDPLGFPDLFFFVPEHLLMLKDDGLWISSYSKDPEELLAEILLQPEIDSAQHQFSGLNTVSIAPVLSPRINREDYIHRIEQLKAHIHRGDCYEINFCQEFNAQQTSIDPVAVFQKLVAISPNPFAVYYKWYDRYLICASPERFFRLTGNTIRSQPIKGTAARELSNARLDAEKAITLAGSAKERAENVMVVDLVRNDLSQICEPGSVQVEELFAVYSYPQVHQMISTIRGELQNGKNVIDVLEACFPMGSMTGAPKKKVLELIEQYELLQRGLFSGAVGYIHPSGDADFNVVIRSILYNAADHYLSYQVGSGITWYADAAAEYDECLLKAAAIREALGAA